MPRPPKSRRVLLSPAVSCFKPRGIPLSALKRTTLTVDEFEALRLADLETFSQEKAAAEMKISRATFGRIVEKAHKTIVDALVNGKAIFIEGGNYQTSNLIGIHCRNCRRDWQIQHTVHRKKNCPRCNQKVSS